MGEHFVLFYSFLFFNNFNKKVLMDGHMLYTWEKNTLPKVV